MSRRSMRRALLVFATTMLLLAAGVWLAARYALRFPDRPAEQRPGRKVTVVIPRGAAFPRVVSILEQHRLISNGPAFRFYANYKGQASKVRAGTYALTTDITPRELLAVLVHGVQAPQVTVLIPEGKNMLEVAEILASAGVAPREALQAAMRDRAFLRRLGVPAPTIEGYLFPDTYRLRADTPPREVLKRLYRRHRAVYHQLAGQHRGRLKWLRQKLRWGHHEIVILASIVEKETGRSHERPLIAGVFLNRLTFAGFSPKLLQTDPTIIYGCTVPEARSAACKQFAGRIRRIHLLDADNPYNTYAHPELPPGPIASPGRASLEAVLAPQRSRYLYFVSKNDGTHHFSASRAEHEQAVDRYQRRRGSTAATSVSPSTSAGTPPGGSAGAAASGVGARPAAGAEQGRPR